MARPIKKSIEGLKNKMIFTNSPKSYFDNNNLKDLLNGKRITVDDLQNESQKNLIMAMYINMIKMNGKVRFHDVFIKGFIGTVVLGGVAAVVLYCLRGIL